MEYRHAKTLLLLTALLLVGSSLYLYFYHSRPYEKVLSPRPNRQKSTQTSKPSPKPKDHSPSSPKPSPHSPPEERKPDKNASSPPPSPDKKPTPPKKAPPKRSFLSVDVKKKRLTVEGVVTIRYGVIEVFACTPRGKRHEAIFTISCDPKMLQFYLIAFGLKPHNPLKHFGEGGTIPGDRVYIYVRWKDPKTKKEVIYRSEDLVFNIKTKKTMKRTGWAFTGSKFEKFTYRTPEGKKVTKEVFLASYAGNLVVTYHDPAAILNNPMDTGGDDTLYYANYLALPPRGHPIEMIFSAHPIPKWDKLSKPYDASKYKPPKNSPQKKPQKP